MKSIYHLSELQEIFETKNRVRMLRQASRRGLLQKRSKLSHSKRFAGNEPGAESQSTFYYELC